jgi:hypothetical protein
MTAKRHHAFKGAHDIAERLLGALPCLMPEKIML